MESGRIIAISEGSTVTFGQFWRHVHRVRWLLPDKAYLINVCEDRYLFCVALFSAALNQSKILLPPSQSTGIIQELTEQFSPLSIVCDRELEQITVGQCVLNHGLLEDSDHLEAIPETMQSVFDPKQIVAIAFTSGSTGKPRQHAVSWGVLTQCAQKAIQALKLDHQSLIMLSTTPPQHMFGLETSVIWPMMSGLIMINQRPFYPEDIRQLAQSLPYPVVLCSTPTHLRACMTSSGDWSNITAVISSTAPLAKELAVHIETRMNTRLYEIYGSTETLSFASRQPAHESAWTLYPDAGLKTNDNHTFLQTSYFQQPVELDDVYQILPEHRFNVLGRATDLIKIAGKRASLADLNQRLLKIQGIEDGCFIQMKSPGPDQRLGLIVVSNLTEQTIRDELKQYLDSVFLPRVIVYTNELPRNSVGKLLESELKLLLN